MNNLINILSLVLLEENLLLVAIVLFALSFVIVALALYRLVDKVE